MKKIILTFTFFIVFILTLVFFSGCDQYVARNAGGTVTINLEPGERLVEATWKDDGDLWYLVEPMDSDYVPKTKTFKESSVMGIMEGKVIFIETR